VTPNIRVHRITFFRGARLGECKTVRGRDVCVGKDRGGNSVQLSAEEAG
jgi:hypothetical protein